MDCRSDLSTGVNVCTEHIKAVVCSPSSSLSAQADFFFLEKQVSLFRFPGCDIWSLLLRAAGDHERCGWEQGKESDPALERVPKPHPAPASAAAASQGSDSSSCWCHRRNYHQPVIWWMNVNMS